MTRTVGEQEEVRTKAAGHSSLPLASCNFQALALGVKCSPPGEQIWPPRETNSVFSQHLSLSWTGQHKNSSINEKYFNIDNTIIPFFFLNSLAQFSGVKLHSLMARPPNQKCRRYSNGGAWGSLWWSSPSDAANLSIELVKESCVSETHQVSLTNQMPSK